MRDDRSVRDIEQVADEIEGYARRLRSVARQMKMDQQPTLSIHGGSTLNTYLPFIYDWICKVESDHAIQRRAFKHGLKSQAQREVARYKRRSRASIQ